VTQQCITNQPKWANYPCTLGKTLKTPGPEIKNRNAIVL